MKNSSVPSVWLQAKAGPALAILSAALLTIVFPPYNLDPLISNQARIQLPGRFELRLGGHPVPD